MSSHTPITGEELEEMKRRVDQFRNDIETKKNLLIEGKDFAEADMRLSLNTTVVMLEALPRCIAEIERLREMNDSASHHQLASSDGPFLGRPRAYTPQDGPLLLSYSHGSPKQHLASLRRFFLRLFR